jgi:peroxiredoxin
MQAAEGLDDLGVRCALARVHGVCSSGLIYAASDHSAHELRIARRYRIASARRIWPDLDYCLEVLMPPILQPGAAAPAFVLSDQSGAMVALADLRGKSAVLAFYPADWSPVCGDQMALYNEVLPILTDLGAQMLGVSVDSRWCHGAFAENRRLRFRLLADFEPKGAMARAFGVYRDQDGTSERALFVVDAAGVIRWSYLSPVDINPGADGILEALESLQKEKQS